jgi:23S rRNA (adenine1618-N6)-methyltransferase
MAKKTGLHSKNQHHKKYDFSILCEKHPALEEFVFINEYTTKTIDFSNSKAVKELNCALLVAHYNIDFWEFPDVNLCPPIPGRVDYIHYVADLLKESAIKNVKVLDIGTGASCIYPLLGNAEYGWKSVATDIDEKSLDYAKQILVKNKLDTKIELYLQKEQQHIFKEILQLENRFSVTMCNPPFYNSLAEAKEENTRKNKGLDNNSTERNFAGIENELAYKGGEKAFLHTYLYESSQFKKQCFWYTTLVSKKENVQSMYVSLEKLGATTIKTIPMHQGNKITRIVAWTFLNKKEREEWNSEY